MGRYSTRMHLGLKAAKSSGSGSSLPQPNAQQLAWRQLAFPMPPARTQALVLFPSPAPHRVPLARTPHWPADLMAHVGAANAFISEAHATGGAVLVHCYAGQSRSAALVIAHLISQGMGFLDAWATTRRARPCIQPNSGARVCPPAVSGSGAPLERSVWLLPAALLRPVLRKRAALNVGPPGHGPDCTRTPACLCGHHCMLLPPMTATPGSFSCAGFLRQLAQYSKSLACVPSSEAASPAEPDGMLMSHPSPAEPLQQRGPQLPLLLLHFEGQHQ